MLLFVNCYVIFTQIKLQICLGLKPTRLGLDSKANLYCPAACL